MADSFCMCFVITVNLSFPCALLLLFMPFMPRRGEEATEFQTYALARCLYSCKDHIDLSAIYQYPIPPSHYLFNITQHLLVAGALLLLICHRGLQDPKLLDRTIRDVDNSIIVLQHIGERFVGGTAGAEMLQNMKENMKHSETWKTRQQKIDEMEAAEKAKKQTTPVPSWPLPGPKRIPGLLQPSTGEDDPSTGGTSASQSALRPPAELQNTSPTSRIASQAAQSNHASPPFDATRFTQHALPSSGSSGPVAMQASRGTESTPQRLSSMLTYNAYEPGYLYPTQHSATRFAGGNVQMPQMPQTPTSNYNSNAGPSSFLDDYYQVTGVSYTGIPAYASSSMMPTYNTPDHQPLWPSDTLNFNIKDLEVITARSHNNSSFINNNNNNAFQSSGNAAQYPFFQF